ncbi:MAG: hypothetical protein KZQ95_02445 [Candidatus Thiodiazotropha sp. (ex Epidulcina cf. delphinae)]|nr:hypothetical protein [Candidatus Thiodiazotropha sp. (ex Epidulcina cf. delphinae)]
MNVKTYIILITLLTVAISHPASAQATPTDVYHQALVVAAEVELIRLEMGAPPIHRPEIAISGAQPREVYFQAQTLFEKSNRLLFEQLRERADSPVEVSSVSEISPDDVLQLVNASLELLRRIKAALQIPESATVSPSDATRTPTDVYRLIVNLNRNLNNLLQRHFAPADVYQQLTYAVGMASTILSSVEISERLGAEPEIARRKTPLDVYRKLIGVYMIVRETMQLSGEQCLTIEQFEFDREDVSPSDVYDIASLLVSELNYLHGLTPGAAKPKDSYYPGDRLPSHVFQRAGRLESQIIAMRDHAAAHPGWFRP